MSIVATALLVIAVGGATAIRAAAAHQLAREEAVRFWPAFAMGAVRARLHGVPAGVLIFAWFFVFGVSALAFWVA